MTGGIAKTLMMAMEGLEGTRCGRRIGIGAGRDFVTGLLFVVELVSSRRRSVLVIRQT